jgi:hypothetical protein
VDNGARVGPLQGEKRILKEPRGLGSLIQAIRMVGGGRKLLPSAQACGVLRESERTGLPFGVLPLFDLFKIWVA